MNPKLFSLVGLILAFTFSFFVNACEQCDSTLNFEDTVNKSDLVIIGQKVNDGPLAIIGNNLTGGPEWIEIRITRVLKGDERNQIIKANSCNSMCCYGVVLPDNEPRVIFLAKSGDTYTSVNQGCSAGPYNVGNNVVDFEGEQIAVEEFASKLGKTTNVSGYQQNGYIYLGISLIIVIALIVLKSKRN